jgi:hypothetical protein
LKLVVCPDFDCIGISRETPNAFYSKSSNGFWQKITKRLQKEGVGPEKAPKSNAAGPFHPQTQHLSICNGHYNIQKSLLQ